MKALTFAATLILIGILPMPAKAVEESTLCKPESLPAGIRTRLKAEYGSWKIQEPVDLNPRARERWESEKPLQCPGVTVGQFEGATRSSYAVLLVRMARRDGAYRFLIFSRKTGQPNYELKVLEQSDDGGAGNFFIRKILINDFFSEESRRKFRVGAKEGVLLVDSAEGEYEADVYFWADGRYRHEPVDY